MDRIIQLLNKHVNATLTPEEEQELLYYVKSGEYDDLIKAKIQEHWKNDAGFTAYPKEQIPVILHKILQSENETARILNNTNKRSYSLYYKSAVLVILLLIICLRTWYTQRSFVAGRHDKSPGRSGALLTLADGSSVALDSTSDGELTPQKNTKLIMSEGSLSYQQQLPVTDTTLTWNTITTPRGSHYAVVLADGSHVWLNAGTSLTYPVHFREKGEKEVILNGEAYFETITDANRPFKVSIPANQQQNAAVKALGTSFNIMAYPDETNVQTTLIEGAVIVYLSGTEKRLIPGQQATFSNRTNEKIYIENIDTAVAIAWKKGFFSFDQCALPMIMRQISRWYDVDVTYEMKVPESSFEGALEMNTPLSDALNTLQQCGLQFEFNGKKIIVKEK